MPFELLKEIIAHLKRTEPCPECGTRLTSETIHVLLTGMAPNGKGCHGFFFVVCPACGDAAFVLVEMNPRHAMNKEFFHLQKRPAGPHITLNEVLDIKNFLKNWKGDVRELFKN